jgi:hypothetical protein
MAVYNEIIKTVISLYLLFLEGLGNVMKILPGEMKFELGTYEYKAASLRLESNFSVIN